MKGSTKFFILMMSGASGAATLAYQVVWLWRLALVFGITTLFAEVVTVLAGMAAGVWIWGRLADRRPQSSLTLFAAVQLATGLHALANLGMLQGVTALYVGLYPSLADHTNIFAGVQFLLGAVVILPPAILSGGTVPLLARHLASNDGAIVGSVGAVYGWNALGSATGAAALTFGLLPAVGLNSTVALAAVVNVLVGMAALWAEMRSRKRADPEHAAPVPIPSDLTGDFPHRIAELLILVGFTVSASALTTFEVGWVRLIAMAIGSSVYVYGLALVAGLAGMGIGSALYSRVQRTPEAHRRSFAVLECMIAFSAALSMLILPRMPFWFARLFPFLRDAFVPQIAVLFVATAIVALLPWLFFGAMFTAVIGSIRGAATPLTRTIGAAYLASTLGAATRVCLAEFALMATVGLHAMMNVAVLATVSAAFAVWWRVRDPRRRRLEVLAPAVAALLILAMEPAWPREVFAAGIGLVAPRLRSDETLGEIARGMRLLYYRDGRNATISVDQTGQTLFLRSNGVANASTDPVDRAHQLLLGHLPMLLHAAPTNVLILGLGTGITAAAVARYPVRQIDIVEGEPAVTEAAKFFDSYAHRVLDDPRVHLIIGDSRNRLLGARQQYDVVISDPSDLWVAGTGSLATLEYYRIVVGRLNRGGVFAQCIHTRALLPDDLDLLTATFHAVFPRMQVWTSASGDLLLLGTRDPVAWNYTRLKQHYAQTQGVADDLKSAGIWHPFALFGAQLLAENESDHLAGGIDELHTDDRPLLEFRSPRSLYIDTAPKIAEELNSFRGPDPPTIAGFEPQRDLDAEGAYLLGFSYASVGRTDLAIKYMELGITMAPGRPMFFVGIGNQYRAAGRVADARKAYERALSLDLNNVEALVSLGEIRLEEGQLDWTRVLSDRALRLAPQDARVHALIDRLQEVEH